MNKKRIPVLVLIGLLLFVTSLAFMSAIWYINMYGNLGFSAIIFTLTIDNGAVEEGIILEFIIKALLPSILITTLLMIVLNLQPKKKIVVKDLKKNKAYQIFPFSLLRPSQAPPNQEHS